MLVKQFAVHGPFKIDCEEVGASRVIRKEQIKEFWQDDKVSALGSQKGCYVFAVRAAKGFKPWYVGRTRNSFKGEVFTPHKLLNYNDCMLSVKRGTPVLFFLILAKKTKTDRKSIRELETFLIQIAAKANEELYNIQSKKGPKWGVKGIIRSTRGPRPKPAISLMKTLNM